MCVISKYIFVYICIYVHVYICMYSALCISVMH